jgi:hypothetical protein
MKLVPRAVAVSALLRKTISRRRTLIRTSSLEAQNHPSGLERPLVLARVTGQPSCASLKGLTNDEHGNPAEHDIPQAKDSHQSKHGHSSCPVPNIRKHDHEPPAPTLRIPAHLRDCCSVAASARVLPLSPVVTRGGSLARASRPVCYLVRVTHSGDRGHKSSNRIAYREGATSAWTPCITPLYGCRLETHDGAGARTRS